jgi:transposase-like protein
VTRVTQRRPGWSHQRVYARPDALWRKPGQSCLRRHRSRISLALNLGGEGKVVEADELYYGTRVTPRQRWKYSPPPTKKGRSGTATKRVILGLVERGGSVRTFHIEDATTQSIAQIMRENVSRESQLQTDEYRSYVEIGKGFKGGHEMVLPAASEYARRKGDRLVTTNTIENVFSVFKRGMRGVYQHCGEKHLHRYLAEFDFRYNNRAARRW